jgi:hypothetical protein
MFNLNCKIKADKKLKLAIFGLLALLIATLPVFAFSSRKSELYVDAKANGEQNGSSAHPYKTINEALRHAKDDADIHVAKGEYEENISIKDGIDLFGHDKDDTIIKSEKKKWATVSMKNNATINGFTIKDGKRGIWIEKDAKASISDCIIKDNYDDGVGIEGGDTKKSNQVYIGKTEIKDNGWSGIYSAGPRRIVLIDNVISKNKKDGVDLASGTSAWIEGNSIRENKASGMKLRLDQSDIWTKDNDIRLNNREGIEVSSYGGVGRIDIAKSKIVKNDRYGIARLQRAGQTNWGTSLTLGSKTELWENDFGNISKLFYIK